VGLEGFEGRASLRRLPAARRRLRVTVAVEERADVVVVPVHEDRAGRPLRKPRLQVVLEGPPRAVFVGPRRALERPAGLPHEVGDLAREVHVGVLEGPHTEELPEDPVRLRPAHEARVTQEEHVHDSFAIELQPLEHKMPLHEGLGRCSSLERWPVPGEARIDELEVPHLVILEVRVTDRLEHAEGREVVPTVNTRLFGLLLEYTRLRLLPPLRHVWRSL
jgi:hypothetical protein